MQSCRGIFLYIVYQQCSGRKILKKEREGERGLIWPRQSNSNLFMSLCQSEDSGSENMTHAGQQREKQTHDLCYSSMRLTPELPEGTALTPSSYHIKYSLRLHHSRYIPRITQPQQPNPQETNKCGTWKQVTRNKGLKNDTNIPTSCQQYINTNIYIYATVQSRDIKRNSTISGMNNRVSVSASQALVNENQQNKREYKEYTALKFRLRTTFQKKKEDVMAHRKHRENIRC